MRLKTFVAFICVNLCYLWSNLPSPSVAQPPDFDSEVKTQSLTHNGHMANAQTRVADHTLNKNPSIPGWGGCVPSSVRTAALHAGVPRADVDRFWAIAQKEVGAGGTDPNLLASMLKRGMPNETWVSVVATDETTIRDTLDKLSSKGHCLGSTMAWGQLYGDRMIAHMISVPHFSSSQNLACVEDNNDEPGIYRWMTADELVKRCFDGGQGWVFAFDRLPLITQALVIMAFIAAALLLLAAAVVVTGGYVLLQ